MPGKDSPDKIPLALDMESYKRAPKFYSHQQLILTTPDEIMILFGLRLPMTGEDGMPIFETQAVCTMTKEVFQVFAQAVAAHSEKSKSAPKKATGEKSA